MIQLTLIGYHIVCNQASGVPEMDLGNIHISR